MKAIKAVGLILLGIVCAVLAIPAILLWGLYALGSGACGGLKRAREARRGG